MLLLKAGPDFELRNNDGLTTSPSPLATAIVAAGRQLIEARIVRLLTFRLTLKIRSLGP